MELWKELVSQLMCLGLMVYALCLVAGAPFVGAKLANRYARWMLDAFVSVTLWIAKLPFRVFARFLFGKKQKKRKRKK